MHPEKHFAIRALRSGAAGYLTKDYSETTLLKAVRQVLAGRRYVSSSLAERLVSDLMGDTDRPPHDTLSKQEYWVMCLIASGKTVSQIAEELCLSVKTVSTYRVRILDKVQMQNNAELTRYCIVNGLV
ncbi:MAG: LuxR C-terminal-related transcriptional regulator [Gammaproteobacteria bacterium]